MNQSPPDNFVRRNRDKNEQAVLNSYARQIECAVDYGAKIMFWEPRSDHDGSPVSPMLLWQFIEILDSLSILVKNGSAEMVKSILRNAFEVNLYVHFIQEKHSENRAYSFLVVKAINRIKELNKLRDDTPQGRALKAKLAPEGIIKDFSEKIAIGVIEKEIESINLDLKSPVFTPIITEYERIRNSRKGQSKNIKWHELFEGASNISDLATHLKKATFYEILYRDWSGAVHSTEIFKNKMNQTTEGVLRYNCIRQPMNLCFLSKMACNFAINTYGHYVKNRHPQMLDEYNKWQETFTKNYEFDLDHEYISFSG